MYVLFIISLLLFGSINKRLSHWPIRNLRETALYTKSVKKMCQWSATQNTPMTLFSFLYFSLCLIKEQFIIIYR